MEELSGYKDAAVSVVDTLRNPGLKGGFRKVCVAAMDYAHRSKDRTGLGDKQKLLVSKVLKLGTTINDFYDMGLLEAEEYKNLRREFKRIAPEREADFRKYRKELASLEKHRPIPSELHEEGRRRLEPIKKYREDVNRLSLAFSFAIAFDKPLSAYQEDFEKQPESERNFFNGFYNCVMAMQVVDDIVGKEGDLRNDRPSFYTAVCSPDEIKKQQVIDEGNKETYERLNALFNEYYNRADCSRIFQIKTDFECNQSDKSRLSEINGTGEEIQIA